jgi:malonyl CoA-acyl carrier protein transacylase
MAKMALVFPGQGKQHVGVGSSLLEKFSAVRDILNQTNSA